MAHYHSNKKYNSKGFQIAQAGAWGNVKGQNTDSGFLYLDTTGDTETITYFVIYDKNDGTNEIDNANKLKECFEENGIGNCLYLGTNWLNIKH